MTLPELITDLEAKLAAATEGEWKSMRVGNQYLDCRYLPTAKLVGASRVDGLPRPWNPHAVIAFMRLDDAEVSRFKDEDADFIAAAKNAMPVLLTAIRRAMKVEEAARKVVKSGSVIDEDFNNHKGRTSVYSPLFRELRAAIEEPTS